MNGEPMTDEEEMAELSRLRNRHVAKTLEYLGSQPPYVESAIKRAMTWLTNDIAKNVLGIEYDGRERETDGDND